MFDNISDDTNISIQNIYYFQRKMSVTINLNNCKISNSNKKAFIFEGGGTKGIYSIGLLKYLFTDENAPIKLSDIYIFGGTSVGSYIAAALSLGYTIKELDGLTDDINISKLIDPWYYLPLTLTRLARYGYLYDSIGRTIVLDSLFKQIISGLKKDLNENISHKEITFGHLKTLIKMFPKKYKHLLINAVDLNNNEQIFFTTLNENSDNLTLYDALMASSAIPFAFEPTIIYRDNKKFYSKNIGNLQKIIAIDGGTSNNNPLDYFMIDIKDYSDYDFHLLKYNSPSKYVDIKSNLTAMERIIFYWLSERNTVNMEVIGDFFNINIINLHVDKSPLYIPTNAEIKSIIITIIEQCNNNKIDTKILSPNTFLKKIE